MLKNALLIALFVMAQLTLSSGYYSYKENVINKVSSQVPSLCIGDNETRYFIRINKIENIDSTINTIRNAISMLSDSINQFYVNDISTNIKRIKYKYKKYGIFGLNKIHYDVNILIDQELQVIGIWTYRYTGSRIRSKSKNTISEKLYKKILNVYTYGEYLGKQELICFTKPEYKSMEREKFFWDWFSSIGQYLLEHDNEKYFRFVQDALETVGRHLICNIDKKDKIVIFSGDQEAIERLKKYEPDKLLWSIRYEKK